MRETLSPKQVAQVIGVSEASLKRWCDKGLIPFHKTHGGHRRIPLSGVMNYLRENELAPSNPEILGLPATTNKSKLGLRRALDQITEALLKGDASVFRQIGYNLYLSGHQVYDICDKVLAPAFHNVGTLWQHGDMEIYQERRGVEICMEFLIEMRISIPEIPQEANLAITATLSDDPYSLPSLMAELSLKSIGWRGEFYGNNLPIKTLQIAVKQKKTEDVGFKPVGN